MALFSLLKDSGGKTKNLVSALIDDYLGELRMAQQFQDHAAKAPYPQFAEKLYALAQEEKKHAELLQRQILSLGGRAEEKEITTKSGWNNWQRLVVDLDDEQSQQQAYAVQAVRFAFGTTDLRTLLIELANEEAGHIVILRDLILRSDPQAGR